MLDIKTVAYGSIALGGLALLAGGHATWEAEVHKMVAVYKAPVPQEDTKAIVAYLDSIMDAK